MKLIDKDKIAAEIEKRRRDWRYGSSIEAKFKREECDDILSFLDTLETKEVDLEEEINRFWDSCIKHKNERGGNVIWSNKLEIEVLARHFFELGQLNERKD